MDFERFAALCDTEQDIDGGIGTLNEKQLHRVLKNYFEPRAEFREVPFEGYVADIKNEEGVTEIQTRGYSALRPKLEAFLPLVPVRVVMPLVVRRELVWLDADTGELSAPRTSPKRGAPVDAFYELRYIAKQLCDENLTLHLVLFNAQEIKVKGGRHGVRELLKPLALVDERVCRTPYDYANLLPPQIPDEFTRKELTALFKRSERLGSFSVYTLQTCGGIEAIGKKGRAILYRKAKDPALELEEYE